MDDGKLVTLREMLAARENRAARQRQLLREYGDPLISFTMNLAGPVKRGRLSDLLFWTVLKSLEQALGNALVCRELTEASTGLEALSGRFFAERWRKLLRENICISNGGLFVKMPTGLSYMRMPSLTASTVIAPLLSAIIQ